MVGNKNLNLFFLEVAQFDMCPIVQVDSLPNMVRGTVWKQGRIEVKLSLCLTKYHDMKTYCVLN